VASAIWRMGTNSFNAHLAKPISLLGFTIFRINPV